MEFERFKEWQKVKFEELVGSSHTGLVRSAKEQSSHRQYSYLKMNNLNLDGSFSLRDLTKVDASAIEVEKNTLKSGDFLFNTRNSVELVGKCGVFNDETDTPMLFNNNLLKVNFLIIKPELVAAWFNSPLGKQQLRSITSATTSVAAIYQKQLMKLDIPIPPLAEQKVIVEKLDKLSAKVDSIKARLERIPEILKTFRQSVLAAAVSGKLTEEWRNKQNLNIESWSDGVLGDFVEKPTYGSSSKSQTEGAIPVLRMGNLQGGELDWTDLVYTSDPVEIDKYKLSYGDVLFNRTNSPELVGKTSIYRGERDAIYAGYLIRIVCKSNLHPEFLNYLLNSPDAKDYCYQVKSDGVSQSNINAQKLKAFPVNIPTLFEQTQVVRRVEKLFAFADKVEAQVNAAQERVNQLTQSILAKAFRGELTAKWREQNPELISGENSAEALLAKIKAEREKLKPAKKVRKKASKVR